MSDNMRDRGFEKDLLRLANQLRREAQAWRGLVAAQEGEQEPLVREAEGLESAAQSLEAQIGGSQG
jgi:hypothetical protein